MENLLEQLAFEEIESLLTAIELELKEIKQTNFNVVLENGAFLNEAGNRWIYLFRTDAPIDIVDDSEVKVEIKSKSVNAVIISSFGLQIKIAFQENFGETIESILVKIQTNAILRLLFSKLQNMIVVTPEKKLRIDPSTTELALKLFGKIAIAREKVECILPALEFKPDIYQEEAIEESLSKDVTFIWGPPGTGKTITIAILLKILYDLGQSVLITSNTNIAVDNIFDKFIDQFKLTFPQMSDGSIIRIGNSQIEKVRLLLGEESIINKMTEEKNLKLWEKNAILESYTKEAEVCERRIQKKQELIRIDKFLANTHSRKKSIEGEIYQLTVDLDKMKLEIDKLSELAKSKNEELNRAIGKGFLYRVLKNLKSPKKISEQLNKILLELKKKELKYGRFQESINAWSIEVERYSNQIERRLKDKNLILSEEKEIETESLAVLEAQHKFYLESIEVIRKEIHQIREELEKQTNQILLNAMIVGTTLTMLYSKPVLTERSYDVVIIDEVTMALQPMIFFAALYARKKVVVVGDFFQIQPIVQAKDPSVRARLANNIFKVNQIDHPNNPILSTLRIQRRMKAPISEISNQTLYKGILQNNQPKAKLTSEPAVSFYNTNQFHPLSIIPSSGKGRINLYNVLVAVLLAQKYFRNSEVSDIGIISPYRAQVKIIGEIIRDLGMEDKVMVSTVHKFQGIEKDVIIFDIADAEHGGDSNIGQPLKNEEAPYLFNVAFTRAKNKLILIGDLGYLKSKKFQLPDTVKNMFNIIIKQNDICYETIDACAVTTELQALDLPSIYEKIISNIIQSFDEKTFYNDLEIEILKCKNRLVIYSPYIGLFRTQQSFRLQMFANLRQQGVEIVIYCKGHLEQSKKKETRDLMEKWQKMGIKINIDDKYHQKIVLIDSSILYYGSLNILSCIDTKESMLKIENKSIVANFIKEFDPGSS